MNYHAARGRNMASPKSKKKAGSRPALRSTSTAISHASRFGDSLRFARILAEKCELAEARRIYEETYAQALLEDHFTAMVEAISGLLRLAAEALDEDAIRKWDGELDRMIADHPKLMPATLWYCKGMTALRMLDPRVAQRHFLRFLRLSSGERTPAGNFQFLTRDECIARAWSVLAMAARDQGKPLRAQWIVEATLKRFGSLNLRQVNGTLYHLLGRIAEKRRDYDTALKWFKEAHSTVLVEHNWYYYLYILYSYARIARAQQNYPLAYQYLEMMDKAASGPEFGSIRKEIQGERLRLEQDAVDLLIDSRKGIVRTRESGPISLRKQYVLLSILEELSSAHSEPGAEAAVGLSKAEIIERVWHEDYRPEAHDNKLYYNINRLRKLIEPDMKKPQYLLNWREGYRLAPGLRVQKVGGQRKNGDSSTPKSGEGRGE